jgi:hypothetical protein
LLQSFKDTVLSKTPEGRELIKLFYFWSPLLVKAIEKDEAFKEEITEMIDTMISVDEEESE